MAPRGRTSPPLHVVWDRRAASKTLPAVLRLLAEAGPATRAASRGRLILGDNLPVMQALLPRYEGRLHLIYADPPFNTGKAYTVRIGREEDSRRPEGWRRAPGYRDRWPSSEGYVEMLAPRLESMYRLLAPNGTLYLHLDWRSAAYARILLDDLFGPDRLLNEIVWVYHGPSPIMSAFKRKHDTLLVYTKSSRYTFNADAVRMPYDESTWKTFAGSGKAGFGKRPRLARGKVPEDWWYFPVVARLHSERTGYPTQKPLAMLDRIVRASSRRGDLVADFFCGSGTTAVAAARAGRRWLACDRSTAAIATTYRRLLLEVPDQRFQLWSTVRHRARGSGSLRLRWAQSERTVTIDLASTSIKRTSSGPSSEITLWEVDWDASPLFRSRSRAIRGWRRGDLVTQLRHRYRRSGVYHVQVQAWDGRGRVVCVEREIKITDDRPGDQSAAGRSRR